MHRPIRLCGAAIPIPKCCLAAVAQWGITQTLRELCGMFAFALWDREERVLTLACDPLGEKPLFYYGWAGNALLFDSELKALRAHPALADASLNRDALCLYMHYNSILAPYPIYSGINKLMPGKVATVRPDRCDVAIDTYWLLDDAVQRGRATAFAGSEAEAVTELDSLLRIVLSEQMMADVPWGAFLSGGIDSSTVVALMQALSSRPVKTFTIDFDEAEHARDGARMCKQHQAGTHNWHSELWAILIFEAWLELQFA